MMKSSRGREAYFLQQLEGENKKKGKFSGDSSSRLPRDVCRRDHDVEGPDCLGNRASRRTPHDDHT